MPEIFTQKPIDVEAHQFRGWSDAQVINNWLVENKPFFVPEGYEHGFRTEGERDRSRGDVLQSAKSFLVLEIDGKSTRVNEYDWLVRNQAGQVSTYGTKEFNLYYTSKPEPVE